MDKKKEAREQLISLGAEVKSKFMKNGKFEKKDLKSLNEFYNTKTAYYIVEEYCSQGELFGHIKQDFSEDQIAFILYQILSALCYLHQQNITHRDLKLENILVSDIEEDPDTKEKYYWIKLIDFGAIDARIASQLGEWYLQFPCLMRLDVVTVYCHRRVLLSSLRIFV